MRMPSPVPVTLPLVALPLLISLAVALGSAGAQAACSDEIAALDKQTDQAGRSAIASNSAGQKDAAARASQAQEARKTDTPVAALPNGGDSGGGTAATQAAADASGAGEGVMAAKVSLNEARNAQGKGDEAACLDAVRKAKAQLAK